MTLAARAAMVPSLSCVGFHEDVGDPGTQQAACSMVLSGATGAGGEQKS